MVERDTAILSTRKDGWRGNLFKEREIQRVIREKEVGYAAKVDQIFAFVKNLRDC